jgi:hypothetical protein
LVQSNAEASVSPEKNGKVEKTEKVIEKVTDKKVEKVEIIEDEEILEAEGKFVLGIYVIFVYVCLYICTFFVYTYMHTECLFSYMRILYVYIYLFMYAHIYMQGILSRRIIRARVNGIRGSFLLRMEGIMMWIMKMENSKKTSTRKKSGLKKLRRRMLRFICICIYAYTLIYVYI